MNENAITISACNGLRPPQQVMDPERLGAFHQTRLSFVRCLMRRMAKERWTIEREYIDVALTNEGEARYRIETPQGTYTFLALAHRISEDERTDRAIAEKWDYTFCIHNGIPAKEDMLRLRENVPLQDYGRYTSDELVISRANKSVRLFEKVVAGLAKGVQPEPAWFVDVGYLVRTTAVFANGFYGMADYARLCQNSAFPQPFAVQMLTVYLVRLFSVDLVDHFAQKRSPNSAVPLSRQTRRFVGVGNATGLGMAPFLIEHPGVLHSWIAAREEALSRVLEQPEPSAECFQRFQTLLERTIQHVQEWHTSDHQQTEKISQLGTELKEVKSLQLPTQFPWRHLAGHAGQNFTLETQEILHSIIMELYPKLVDDLECTGATDATPRIYPQRRLSNLKHQLEEQYDWATVLNYEEAEQLHFFWYKSAMKAEPRIGTCGVDPGDDREMIVDMGRDVSKLYRALSNLNTQELTGSIARFLLSNPEHRAAVQRVHSLERWPYGEIRANLTAKDCVPLKLLRCKLSFFGTVKYDPKSDLWLRITLFQGAPLPDELLDADYDHDDWFAPVSEA